MVNLEWYRTFKYIYKTGLVQNSKNLQFKNFLQKYSINNTAELLPDHNYSFFLPQRHDAFSPFASQMIMRNTVNMYSNGKKAITASDAEDALG